MASPGGTYRGPGGQELYGDGREVIPVSTDTPPPDAVAELIAAVRMCELDHEPDGWPAVKTSLLTGLADALEDCRRENERAGLEIDALHLSLGQSAPAGTEPIGCPCPGACSGATRVGVLEAEIAALKATLAAERRETQERAEITDLASRTNKTVDYMPCDQVFAAARDYFKMSGASGESLFAALHKIGRHNWMLSGDAELVKLRGEAMSLKADRDQLRIRLLTAAGDDLCRLSQEEIKELSSGAVKIPPEDEFLASCKRFHGQIASESGVLGECLTLAQMIAENERLKADLRAARAGWQPIETAPREGQILVCWAGSGLKPIVSRWLKNSQVWTTPFNKPTNPPTHWQLLPEPPQEKCLE